MVSEVGGGGRVAGGRLGDRVVSEVVGEPAGLGVVGGASAGATQTVHPARRTLPSLLQRIVAFNGTETLAGPVSPQNLVQPCGDDQKKEARGQVSSQSTVPGVQ